jgi:hypothetical protein
MRLFVFAVIAACSSREGAPAKERSGGSAQPKPTDVQRAQLPWKPLEIEGQPVQQLHAVPKRTAGKFVFMGGTAMTATGTYDLLWKLDKLSAVPGVGTSDAAGGFLRTFETAEEPIEVIAQIGELQYRALVFRTGERWRLARSQDEGEHWTTEVLPMKGANVASAVDSQGVDIVLAWNDGEDGRWMHIRDFAEKRKVPGEAVGGKLTSTCSNERLWVATDRNKLTRLPYGELHTFSSAPSIIACSPDHALVQLADGSAQLCSRTCKPWTVAKAEPTVQALIGEELVAVEQRGQVLVIIRNETRTEYDAGGVIQRMQLLDFDGTPVLVAYGREGLDPTRFAIIP